MTSGLYSLGNIKNSAFPFIQKKMRSMNTITTTITATITALLLLLYSLIKFTLKKNSLLNLRQLVRTLKRSMGKVKGNKIELLQDNG